MAQRLEVLASHLGVGAEGSDPQLSAFETSASSQDVRGSDARFDAFTAKMQENIAKGRFPGAVFVVQKDDKVIYEAALGDQDPQKGIPMKMDSIFRIYSMTKPITSLAVLMLIEDGRLQLEDPVENHLPEFKGVKVGVQKGEELELVPPHQPMLVRHLLTHTAGLTYGFIPFPEAKLVKKAYIKARVETNQKQTNTELAQTLAKLPLAWQPGTCWDYSVSTDLLGALVERVSGKKLSEFFKQRIFDPLKMNDTAFWVHPDKQSRLAEPFAKDPDSGEPSILLEVRSPRNFESGGGGLVSTAGDYLRFMRMLLNKGELDGVRIASAKTIENMTRDHLGDIRGPFYLPGDAYGFGYGVAVRLEDGKDGSRGDYFWGGMAGTVWVNDPKENMIAIGLVQALGQREEFRILFRKLLYRAIRK